MNAPCDQMNHKVLKHMNEKNKLMNQIHLLRAKGFTRYTGQSIRFCIALCMVAGSFVLGAALQAASKSPGKSSMPSAEQAGTDTFQGSMQLSTYAVTAEGEEQLRSRYHMLVHPGYLSLSADQQGTFRLMGAVSTDGIIVRQEQEQIVFLTRDQQALVMSHTELRQMLAMMDQLRGAPDASSEDPSPEITRSGQYQTIQGYRSEQWKAAVPGHSAEWHIWVTNQVQVPWGILSERWLLERVFPADLPIGEWMHQGLMPLKADMYNGGMLVQTVRFEHITQESLSASHFEVPEGYASMTFQQLLFGQMRNRQ